MPKWRYDTVDAERASGLSAKRGRQEGVTYARLSLNQSIADRVDTFLEEYRELRTRVSRKGNAPFYMRGIRINHFARRAFSMVDGNGGRGGKGHCSPCLEGRPAKDGRTGDPYSEVFRELKQIPRTWLIRLLVRASRTDPPSPSATSSSSSPSSLSSFYHFYLSFYIATSAIRSIPRLYLSSPEL